MSIRSRPLQNYLAPYRYAKLKQASDAMLGSNDRNPLKNEVDFVISEVFTVISVSETRKTINFGTLYFLTKRIKCQKLKKCMDHGTDFSTDQRI